MIKSFLALVTYIQNRSKLNNSLEKIKTVDYPLNQYEQSFVKKAKGRSDINQWDALSKKIENEPKFSNNN